MTQSIERVHLTVDGVPHALAPLEHPNNLRQQILAAVHAHGGFLTVTSNDGSKLNIFVTNNTSITIATETVPLTAETADAEEAEWAPPSRHYDDDSPFDLI